jgi:hypothetical protein
LHEEAAAELGQEADAANQIQPRIKFVPKPTPTKEYNPSPLGKMHVSTPKLAPLVIHSRLIHPLFFFYQLFIF